MRIGIIGRTEILYDVTELLVTEGHDIVLIVTATETPEYQKKSVDFQSLAEKLGAAFIHTPDIRKAKSKIEAVGKIDIAVSINYPGIIPEEVIQLFPNGILNAHGGDLPRYRGNACQAWAILNGESRIGICIHRMIGGELDSGDILCRDYMAIDTDTKITEVYEWMSLRIPHLFSQALRELENNPDFVLERQSNNPQDSLRCYPRMPEDGRIDWNQNAVQVLRLINASNKPYSGAFCLFEGKDLIIWDAELVSDVENFLATPGQITKIGSGYIEAATLSGKIRLKKVEYEGNVMLPDQLIKSIRSRLK